MDLSQCSSRSKSPISGQQQHPVAAFCHTSSQTSKSTQDSNSVDQSSVTASNWTAQVDRCISNTQTANTCGPACLSSQLSELHPFQDFMFSDENLGSQSSNHTVMVTSISAHCGLGGTNSVSITSSSSLGCDTKQQNYPCKDSVLRSKQARILDANNVNLRLIAGSNHEEVPIVHRPTPIHPATNSMHLFRMTEALPNSRSTDQAESFGMTNKANAREVSDVPLDLSQRTARKQSVIQAVPASQQTLLPTCANPNLNPNWIAMKFGATTGPNRMSYPREFKLMVINYFYVNGQNKYRTCKEFQITKSMLNGWLQKIDKIRQSRPGSLKSGRSGRKPQFPSIEKQLFSLYSAHVGTGKKVGNRWIRETARNLAQQQCSKQELAGMCQFSERWLSNFKKRYHINLNRDWSSGASSVGSTNSVGSSSSATEDGGRFPTNKCDELANMETLEVDDHIDSEDCSVGSDSLDTLIDADDSNSNNLISSSMQSVISDDQAHIQEILHKPGQLPIQAFYERFPWLCRKNQIGSEPGRRGRKVQFPGVEKILFERLQQQLRKGERISNRWLQQQARELASQICPKVLQEATKYARCLFSEHWLHNFKKRYGVSLKQSNASIPKISPADTKDSSKNQRVAVKALYVKGNVQVESSESDNNGMTPVPKLEVFQNHNWFISKCCHILSAEQHEIQEPGTWYSTPSVLAQSLL